MEILYTRALFAIKLIGLLESMFFMSFQITLTVMQNQIEKNEKMKYFLYGTATPHAHPHKKEEGEPNHH